MLNTIFVHTDGSSNKEKSIGGWAFCLSDSQVNDPFHKDSGSIKGTHNTAELTAVMNSVHYIYGNIKTCKKIVVFTDSRYVSDPLYYDSLRVWEEQGWRTSAGTKVANLSVWLEFKDLLKQLKLRGISIEVRWVRGHNGNKFNELMDKLAGKACKLGDKNKLYE